VEQHLQKINMKKIANFFNADGDELIYAIRREVLRNGKEKLTPVVRKKGLFEKWIQIVRVDNKYIALDIETDSIVHTQFTCEVYIKNHKQCLADEQGNRIKETIYQEIK
jgi:hypothetical protein